VRAVRLGMGDVGCHLYERLIGSQRLYSGWWCFGFDRFGLA